MEYVEVVCILKVRVDILGYLGVNCMVFNLHSSFVVFLAI
jgi:hypothetical protein